MTDADEFGTRTPRRAHWRDFRALPRPERQMIYEAGLRGQLPADPRIRAVGLAYARSWSRRAWGRLALLAAVVVVLTQLNRGPALLGAVLWIWVGFTALTLAFVVFISWRLVMAERRDAVG